jgi:hypothetical protein
MSWNIEQHEPSNTWYVKHIDESLIEPNNKMENLTITKEKVLEAASKCETAKATLKVLFPEVFKEDKYLKFDGKFEVSNYPKELDCKMGPRMFSNYADKGIWLSKTLNWEIVVDDQDELVLIPTKK